MKLALALCLAAVIGGACTEDPPLSECVPRHGEVVDLNKEPNYSADYLHRWEMDDGCRVRLDVVMTRDGGCGPDPEILIGRPIGSPTKRSETFIYVVKPTWSERDPAVLAAYDPDAELPEEAEYSGFRRNGKDLWTVPSDESFIYLVSEDRVERVPLDLGAPGCG